MKLPAARAAAAIKAHEQATMHVHLPKGAFQDSIMTKLCSAILRILPPEPRINDDQVEYMFAPDAQVLEWAKQQVEECDRAFWQGLDGMDLGPESSLDRWMKLLALAVGIYKTHWCGLWSHALAQDEGPAVTKKAQRTQSRRRDGRAKALQAAVKSELLGLCHSVVNLQAADPKFVARGPASPVHGMAAAVAAAYGDKLHKPAAGSTVNASVGSNSLHMTHGSPVHEPLNSNRWGVMAVAFYCAVYQTRAQEAQAESADLAK